jgi:hypothetical protein
MELDEGVDRERELDELRDADAARRERDRNLTMSERLEMVHQLCAQLSELRPIELERGS